MAGDITARTLFIADENSGVGIPISETGNAGNATGNDTPRRRRRQIIAAAIDQPKHTTPADFGNAGNDTANEETDADLRPIGSTQKVVKPTTRVSKKAAARKVVSSSIDHLNLAVASFVAPDAQMQLHERMMIEPPLCDYAERHADAFVKGGDSIGPMLCVAGLIFWLKRLKDSGHIKLPQAQKAKGFLGVVSRADRHVPQGDVAYADPAQNEQPHEPTPLFVQPIEHGYSDLTATFESITRRG